MTEPSLTLSPPEILEIHDKLSEIEKLRSDLDEARSKILLLELKNEIYTRAFIRSSLGHPPKREKPRLFVVS
jgi:hypothetical protein